MKKIIVLLFFGALTFTGCKKEQIEPEGGSLSTSPVFKMDGTIGGTDISIHAGVNEAFLSTLVYPVRGVDQFSGKLHLGDNFVELSISDGLLGTNTSWLNPGITSLQFQQHPVTPYFSLYRSNLSNSNYVQSVKFTVDGNYVGDSLFIWTPGVYEVCTEVKFTNGVSKTMCESMIVGYQDLASFELKHSCDNQGNIESWIEDANNVNEIKWYVDGNFVSVGQQLSSYLTGDAVVLTAEVLFQNGVSRRHSVVVVPNNSYFYLEDIFSHIDPQNNLYLNDFATNLVVKWNGEYYESVKVPNAGSINVTSISLFGKSPAGKDVYLVKGNLQVSMKRQSDQSVQDAHFNFSVGIEAE